MVAVSLSLKNQLPEFQVLPGELDCAQQLLSKVPNCGHCPHIFGHSLFILFPSFALLSLDFSCNHSDSSSFHGLCYVFLLRCWNAFSLTVWSDGSIAIRPMWDTTRSGTGTSDSHSRMATQLATQRIFLWDRCPSWMPSRWRKMLRWNSHNFPCFDAHISYRDDHHRLEEQKQIRTCVTNIDKYALVHGKLECFAGLRRRFWAVPLSV